VPNEIPMTAEDVARLEAELQDLKTEGRRRVRKDLAKALSFGDFRENAELDEARRAHGILEGRIADLIQLLGRVEVIEPGEDSRVAVGATVVASDLETQEEICLCLGMAGTSEVAGLLVTPDSPVGRALIGKAVSDEIEVQTPSGARRYRLLSVTFPARES
jgi:transcription elongation factor GreA